MPPAHEVLRAHRAPAPGAGPWTRLLGCVQPFLPRPRAKRREPRRPGVFTLRRISTLEDPGSARRSRGSWPGTRSTSPQETGGAAAYWQRRLRTEGHNQSAPFVPVQRSQLRARFVRSMCPTRHIQEPPTPYKLRPCAPTRKSPLLLWPLRSVRKRMSHARRRLSSPHQSRRRYRAQSFSLPHDQ